MGRCSAAAGAQLPKQAAGTAVSNRMHNPATTNVLILETAVPAAKSTNSRHQAILISADLFHSPSRTWVDSLALSAHSPRTRKFTAQSAQWNIFPRDSAMCPV